MVLQKSTDSYRKFTRKKMLSSHPVFFSSGLGRCTKMIAKSELNDNTQSVFQKNRNVPLASLKQINEELDRWVKTGELAKLQYSDWVAPTVYVIKKSKEICICADFSTELNAALKVFNYPLPCPEDIFVKLKGGKIFSKINPSDTYLQIPVEEESSKLLCINTYCSLFKFERLPFGVMVAPAIFHQVMDTMLSGFDFAVAYLDDILMKSQSLGEHKEHVHKVFAKIQDYGFKLKESKCYFFMEKIKYLGHIIDRDGRRPDPGRAAAIKDMSAPNNIATLQSFLGLANYYQIFIPNMYDLHALLNELLKKDKLWEWTT